MATARVNGVRLYYELHGSRGVPLVLVHGSWDSHEDWAGVVPELAKSYRVLVYDRRGHSDSERPAGQGSIREDVADAAALIEHLGLAPAWVAANSFGASISLRLAGEHPGLFRGLITHEPPLFGLLAEEPAVAPMLDEVSRLIGAVAERIAAGEHAVATEQFVETVALGPGTWNKMPAVIQKIMIGNAPTFLDESRDPDALDFDTAWIRGFQRPALLTQGDCSPPTFAPVVRRIAAELPQADVYTFRGAGHVPHSTHPEDYVAVTRAFIDSHVS